MWGLETLAGAASGLLIKTWSNALGKKRLLAKPWEHVICIGIGSYIGYNYSKWGDELLESVNSQRMKKGMPTITRYAYTIHSSNTYYTYYTYYTNILTLLTF